MMKWIPGIVVFLGLLPAILIELPAQQMQQTVTDQTDDGKKQMPPINSLQPTREKTCFVHQVTGRIKCIIVPE